MHKFERKSELHLNQPAFEVSHSAQQAISADLFQTSSIHILCFVSFPQRMHGLFVGWLLLYVICDDPFTYMITTLNSC